MVFASRENSAPTAETRLMYITSLALFDGSPAKPDPQKNTTLKTGPTKPLLSSSTITIGDY